MNYYFQYDLITGVIYPVLSVTAPATQGMGLLGPYPQDTASADVVLAYTYPNRYLVQNGQLVAQPYFTATVNGGAINATLNNPLATLPATADIAVLGQTISVPITNNIATLALQVHPSIATQQVQATVSATGCVQATVTLGGTSTTLPLQAYKDSAGTWHIAPTQKAVIQGYYALAVSAPVAMADTTTALGMLLDTVYGTMLPALVTTKTVTLDANQAGTLADMTTNLLPKIPVTLETALTNIHYESLRADWATVEQAFTDYANDLSTIPNLA